MVLIVTLSAVSLLESSRLADNIHESLNPTESEVALPRVDFLEVCVTGRMPSHRTPKRCTVFIISHFT
jgi:hypothetical protein